MSTHSDKPGSFLRSSQSIFYFSTALMIFAVLVPDAYGFPKVLYAAIPLVCLYWVYKLSGWIRPIPSILTLYLATFVMMVHSGVLILMTTDDEIWARLANNYNVGLFALVSGASFAILWRGFNHKEEGKRWLSIESVRWDEAATQWAVLFCFFSIAVVLFVIYFRFHLPLFEGIRALLAGQDFDLLEARKAISYYESGAATTVKYLEQFRIGGLMFLVCLSFIRYSETGLMSWRIVSFLLGSAALVLLAGAGQRWPGMMLVFSLALVYILTGRRRSMNWKLLMRRFVVVVAIVVLVVVFQTWLLIAHYITWDSVIAAMQTAFQGLMDRVVYVNARVGYMTVAIYPDYLPFEYGSTWLDSLSVILPGQRQGFATRHMRMLFGSIGTAPIPVLLEFYVNYGLIGTLIGSWLFGMGLQSLQIWMVRARVSPASLASYIVLTVLCATGLSTGLLLGPIYNGAVLVPLLAWGMNRLQARHRMVPERRLASPVGAGAK